ncbi:hypothetical protein [Streptomyces sp. NPDC102283]|uniref:hypothetical protein n=1 Tax=Streptomyces sp. NPDC102283 TaxID=3366155 RepID=UPI0037FC4566
MPQGRSAQRLGRNAVVIGADAIVDPADVASGKIPVYAGATFLEEFATESSAIEPIMGVRARRRRAGGTFETRPSLLSQEFCSDV